MFTNLMFIIFLKTKIFHASSSRYFRHVEFQTRYLSDERNVSNNRIKRRKVPLFFRHCNYVYRYNVNGKQS